MDFKTIQALDEDKEQLAELRVLAMKKSLEAIGRFDPKRTRLRLLDNFSKSDTWKIHINNKLSGFYVLKNKKFHILLDHLYIHPMFQGNGIGSKIICHIVENNSLPIHVGALRNSQSNSFYIKHGFKKVDEDEWDIYYIRDSHIQRVNSERK
jgi:N-acetylglutamate synthase-like GNAT family acetyltransferase